MQTGKRAAAFFIVLLLGLASCGGGSVDEESAVVAAVLDGDTVELTNGERVRLVQIDAPEIQDDECYARESAAALAATLPPGTAVELEADSSLDTVDRFDRLLRYVINDGENVNLTLVEQGAVTVWFFQGDRGRYARDLLELAGRARERRLGLWEACPNAVFDPSRPASTGPEAG